MKKTTTKLEKMSQIQQLTYELISVGTNTEPITRRQLCNLLSLSDRRVRVIVKSLNRFVPIVSLTRGYYIADDPGEIDLYITSLQRKVDGLKSTISYLKEHREKMVKHNEF